MVNISDTYYQNDGFEDDESNAGKKREMSKLTSPKRRISIITDNSDGRNLGRLHTETFEVERDSEMKFSKLEN